MIDIVALKDFSSTQISELVDSEAGEIIEVHVPKTSKLYFSERQDIAYDYILAAYAGQKLSEISFFFEYEEVPPALHESILFQIKVADKDVLALVIMDLTYLYDINEDSEADEIEQLENISEFEGDIETKKIIPACPYFIEVWKEFNLEED